MKPKIGVTSSYTDSRNSLVSSTGSCGGRYGSYSAEDDEVLEEGRERDLPLRTSIQSLASSYSSLHSNETDTDYSQQTGASLSSLSTATSRNNSNNHPSYNHFPHNNNLNQSDSCSNNHPIQSGYHQRIQNQANNQLTNTNNNNNHSQIQQQAIPHNEVLKGGFYPYNSSQRYISYI
jgi:hypothetical protein